MINACITHSSVSKRKLHKSTLVHNMRRKV